MNLFQFLPIELQAFLVVVILGLLWFAPTFVAEARGAKDLHNVASENIVSSTILIVAASVYVGTKIVSITDAAFASVMFLVSAIPCQEILMRKTVFKCMYKHTRHLR